MPGRSIQKTLLHATAKVDGKPKQWLVGVFASDQHAKAFAVTLRMAYNHKDVQTVKAMDIHSPVTAEGAIAEDVKFSKSTIQYNPEPPALDDDAVLG